MALKILLADDSMIAQNMGKKILTDAGYEVVGVSNGAAAVKKLPEIRPNIVLLDVYMPGYNGLEVCERIKNSPATADVPVLLTVGKLEPFRAEEGMKVKADGVIVKPFEASDLIAVVSKLAERVAAASANVPAPTPPPAAAVDPAAVAVPASPPFRVVEEPQHQGGEVEADSRPPAIEMPQEVAAAPAFGQDMLGESAAGFTVIPGNEEPAPAAESAAEPSMQVQFAEPEQATSTAAPAQPEMASPDTLSAEVHASVAGIDVGEDVPAEAAVEVPLGAENQVAETTAEAPEEPVEISLDAEPEPEEPQTKLTNPPETPTVPVAAAPGLEPTIYQGVDEADVPAEPGLMSSSEQPPSPPPAPAGHQAVPELAEEEPPEFGIEETIEAGAGGELDKRLNDTINAYAAAAAVPEPRPVPVPPMAPVPVGQTPFDDHIGRALEQVLRNAGNRPEVSHAAEVPRSLDDLDEDVSWVVESDADESQVVDEPAAEFKVPPRDERVHVGFGPDVGDAHEIAEEPSPSPAAATKTPPAWSERAPAVAAVPVAAPAARRSPEATPAPPPADVSAARARAARSVDNALEAVNEAIAEQIVDRVLHHVRPDLIEEVKRLLGKT